MIDSKALLALQSLQSIGPKSIHTILQWLHINNEDIGLLLEYSKDDLVAEGLLTADQADQFTSQEHRDQTTAVIEAAELNEISIVPLTSSRYPEYMKSRLGSSAPPVLWIVGNEQLLGSPAIAFAGARHVSESGIANTRILSGAAAAAGFNVLSGGAKGSDSAAHVAAIDAGGSTTVVLAEGMLSPRAKSIQASVDPASMLIVSTFLPSDTWQSWRAMERNKYMLGLSDRLVVIEAGDKGGTLAAGKEALKLNVPTWALDYAEYIPSASGNPLLFKLGARRIPVASNGEVTPPQDLFSRITNIETPSLQPKLF